MIEHNNLDFWWNESPKNMMAILHTSLEGLTSIEAKSRLKIYGNNVVSEKKRKILVLQFIMRFKNPLILVLLIASLVSALSGEITNFVIISAMILISVILDFFQEYRANSAAEKLKLSVCLQAFVIRDNSPIRIPAQQIVPGDIVLLSAGDLIPADGQLIEARDFYVNQSVLTGEAYPVEKKTEIKASASAEMLEAKNAVFMGTSALSGSARMLVVKTGSGTSIGNIATRILQPSEITSFEIGTRKFGLLILRLTMFMVIFVLLVNAYLEKPWLESFLFAVALAVGLTPELLPLVTSVTLSRGAIRMAKKHIIVKRLSAIVDLGAIDILCTDKTGTLTEAKINLEVHVNALGQKSERVFELAYLNSFFETGLRSPLDEAILDHHHIEIKKWKKIDEVPFDFERRRVSVLLDNKDTRLLVIKGAPEDIINLCTYYESESGKKLILDNSALTTINNQLDALEENGFRVLGIAWKELELSHVHAVVGDERNLVFAGFAAFLDPPKKSAAKAIELLNKTGVTTKIVTGDSELVTKHICTKLKIPAKGILTGKEISLMDDLTLHAKVESINLFCRVTPSQKQRVILALKEKGHTVGYLGDGINDAPSLHAADVGISVDSAVDVAREAADMILLRHDLKVLHSAVMEGRRTFANIMKYLMMGTSSNFGNMFSMAGAALFLPFLPMQPSQILLNNILYDISEVPIPLDKVDVEEIRNPRSLDIYAIQKFMLLIGPISSAFDFFTFYIMLVVLHANEKLFQTCWFIESLCTQVLVIFVIRTRNNPLESWANPILTVTSLIMVAIATVLPLTVIGKYFGFVPPPPKFYLVLTLMIISYLCLVELAKQRFYKQYNNTTTVN